MGRKPEDAEHVKKKERPIDRDQTTALYLLRCTELHIPMSDLDLLDVGMILDMFIEAGNDSYEWATVADQDDFDRF